MSDTELSIRDGQVTFDAKQLAALKQLGMDGASNADLAIFFHQVARTGLDPFARQVYMIGRNTFNDRTKQWEIKQTIQTGIDGFRLIARRAVDKRRESLGYEDDQWCGEDGRWTDVWLSTEPPRAAKVTVLRDGHAFSAVALLSEYRQLKRDGSPTKMWADRPSLMLAKCAEALALRKAFPQDLSGLHTVDEMGDDDPAVVVADDAQPAGSKRMSRKKPDVVEAEAAVVEPETDWDTVEADLAAERAE